MKKCKISPATLARTAALALALTNQVLSATGHRVLPIESAELEQLVSTGLTIATALVSWWKNNSFTPEAIEADDFLCQLKDNYLLLLLLLFFCPFCHLNSPDVCNIF